MNYIRESLTARAATNRSAKGWLLHAAYRCTQCQALSIGRDVSASPAGHNERMAEGPREWFPASPISKTFEDVPSHIAEAATEATKCLSLGCYRAAGALARAVVEATAKERGITSGMLEKKIDELHKQGLIRKDTAEAAHEVRHFGNDMAHGDFTDPVTEEDASEVLGLMEEVLNEVYQGPARTAARRQKRHDRKALTQA